MAINKKKETIPCYHNDYAPRYNKGYNIYDKAREHMKRVKKCKTIKIEK